MNKKHTVIGLCFFVIASTHSAQPPAKSREECRARAHQARRQCQIAYYSQCMSQQKKDDEKCEARAIDRDCHEVYQEVYDKEIEAMVKNLNAQNK